MKAYLDSSWTVAQTLGNYPQEAVVFLALKTNCVGCHLDRFCTLEDVAASYNLSLEELVTKLRVSIDNSEKVNLEE